MNLGYCFDLRQLGLVPDAIGIRLRHRLVGQAWFFLRISLTDIAGAVRAFFYHSPPVSVGYMWRFVVCQIPRIVGALVSRFPPGH